MSELRLRFRPAIAAVLLAACGGGVSVNNEAEARTPVLAWQQAKELSVLCLVAPGSSPVAGRIQAQICDEVRNLAALGAPIPVRKLTFGDPALLEPDRVTLLVHANIQQLGAQQLLIFHIRDFRAVRLETQTFFTAAPRALAFHGDAIPKADLRNALQTSLKEMLPWLAPQSRSPKM